MIFPFTIKYREHIEIKTSEDNVEFVMKYIEDFIRKKNGNIVISNRTKLIFNSSLFSGNSWSIFAPIEKGEFNFILEKDKYKLSYEFFMFRLFIIVSIMSVFMWFVSEEIEVVFMCFAWLGGMNWLVAIIRHRLMFTEIKNGIINIQKQNFN